MQVIEMGPKHFEGRYKSDIFRITDSDDGLTILIETKDAEGNSRDLRVNFLYARGIRYLKKDDLLHYWKADSFTSPYHVYEIVSGGWSNGEKIETGLLETSIGFGMREWFICTTNGCVNVISDKPPEIEYVDA